jgi:hypothetical protein
MDYFLEAIKGAKIKNLTLSITCHAVSCIHPPVFGDSSKIDFHGALAGLILAEIQTPWKPSLKSLRHSTFFRFSSTHFPRFLIPLCMPFKVFSTYSSIL